ncbi:sugar porter family MFS transporter [Actinospica sp.]|jgi:SP family sugar:H+ symporter-like MFS transporter|uniref:sugar porter family MFS transporter n=1 Tax=Actinospica sp. TaxID=1872142 RepID=UPI002B71C7D3|nr:sugar porter family MFS transporter [Actinospica sp.]HWG27896.1 sugar porter family MFS transporter [Actinospica sp.]
MATMTTNVQKGEEHFGYVVFIAAAAAMGGFLFGYDSSVINGAVTGIQKHFNVGSNQTGFAVASALLGSAFGAWFAGSLADRIGRVKVMLIAAVLFVISGVFSGLAVSIVDLSIWRIIGGMGIGIASVIAPAYIAEVAPPQYRGRLGSLQQMAIVLGIFISQLINYGLSQAANGQTTNNLWGLQAWRWMLIIEAFPALLYGLLALLVPESPRYLIANNKHDQAVEVLTKVEGPNIDIEGRIADIHAVLASEHKPGFRNLLGPNGFVLPIVLVGIGLSVFQQFVGINVIFYYSSLLWQSVGYNVSNSLLLSVSTSIVNVIGTVVAISVIDRIGRKPLALIGSAGMTVSLGVVAWAFSHVDKATAVASISKGYGTTAIVGAHVYVFFFAMSWGVVVWVLLGEMFPNKIRALALSVAAAFQWVANFAISQSFPTMSRWSLSGSYIIYACFAFLSFPFIVKFVRETKGKSLEEMG